MLEEDVQKILLGALVLGVALIGGAILIAAINLGGAIGSGILVPVVIFSFQVLIIGAVAVLTVVVVWSIISFIYSDIVKRMISLEMSNSKIFQELNKRTPTFAVSTALISSIILLLADKSFNGETIPTICVGVVLTLLFWIANELFATQSRLKRILGGILWLVGILLLPLAVYLFHGGQLVAIFSSLGIVTTLFLCIAFLVACVAPIALKDDT